MKRLLALLIAVTACGHLLAQSELSSPTLKMGAGYTHDFPGVNGYTVTAEYVFPLIAQIHGAIGIKHADMEGFPRTTQVQEYTKSNSLDFNAYWVPLQNETQTLRIGLGYSFSLYSIKRAYPIITGNGVNKITTWPYKTNTGRTTGINLIVEYEYDFPNSPLTIGVRGALYKAYNRTYYIGPTLGYRFL
jgi:hypothetical protein